MQFISDAESQTDKSCVGVSNGLGQGSAPGAASKRGCHVPSSGGEEVAAWELERNSLEARVDWQLTSDDARIN